MRNKPIRNIKFKTYWKMMNTFSNVAKHRGNWKFFNFFNWIINSNDDSINSKSVEQWYRDFIVEDVEIKKFEWNGDPNDTHKMNYSYYKNLLSIMYPMHPISSEYLLINLLENHLKKSSNEISIIINDLKNMRISIEKYSLNGNIPFSLSYIERKRCFKTSDFNKATIKLLSSMSYEGFKLFAIKRGEVIIPFWTWTETFLVYALNKMYKREGGEDSKIYIEKLIKELLLKNFEISENEIKINHKYSVNNNKGEIDLAFVKDGGLFIFEIKNVDAFNNPIDSEKNEKTFHNWDEQANKTAVKQLNRIREFSKNVFIDWQFKNIHTFRVSFGINRHHHTITQHNDREVVYTDINSIIFACQFKHGNELMEIISFHSSSKLTFNIYDWADWAGLIQRWDFIKNKNLFLQLASSMSDKVITTAYKDVIEKNLFQNERNLAVQWNGNFQPFATIQFIELIKNDRFFPYHSLSFICKSEIIKHQDKLKLIKFLFGDNYCSINYETKEIIKIW